MIIVPTPWQWAAALGIVAISWFGCAETSSQEEYDDRSAALLSGLRSDDIQRRDKAEEQLLLLGTKGLAALEKERHVSDPETRERVERIIREIRSPKFLDVPLVPGDHVRASYERLWIVLQTREDWAEIVEAFRGGHAGDPPLVDFGSQIVLVLLGGTQPSTGFVCRVDDAKADVKTGDVEIVIRDGLSDPSEPQATAETHPFSVHTTRRRESRFLLRASDRGPRMEIDLPEARRVEKMEAVRLGSRLGDLAADDPSVRRAVALRLADLHETVAAPAALERLSLESDPTVFRLLFTYLKTRSSPETDTKVLQAALQHPYLSRGMSGHTVPTFLFRKHLADYLARAASPQASRAFAKHGLVCGECPARVLDYVTVLAAKRLIDSTVASSLVHHHPRMLDRILSIVAKSGDPAVLEICLAGLEGQDEEVLKTTRRHFNAMSPRLFEFQVDRPGPERARYVAEMREWLTKNRARLRWNSDLRRFELP